MFIIVLITDLGGAVATGAILFFVGLVLYNFTTRCGQESIDEEKIQVAQDVYEDEYFTRVEN